MSEIPATWEWSTIGNVTQYIQRGKSPKYAEQSALPVINQKCIRWNELQLQHLKYIHPDQIDVWDEPRYIQPGDVLWNSTGTGTVGRAYLVKNADTVLPKVVDSHVTIVRAAPDLEPRYLFNWIKSPAVQNKIEEMCDGTTNQIELSRTAIAATAIPIAPRAEQTRIADQLDTLLTRVNACNDHLDAIPGILKRLRQTVADHACSGLLSTEWRSSEKRSEWLQQQLAAMCHSISDGDHQAPPKSDDGIPFITIAAINDGHLRLDKASRFVSQQYFEGLKAVRRPEPGDLLLSVTGSIGIPALVNTDEPFTFQRHIAILKPDTSVVLSEYLWLMLRTSSARDQMLNVATGTAQLTVPLSALRKLIFKLPNLAEQAEIVRSSKKLFAAADRIEACYTAMRARTLRLAPQILAKAFRGELVEQDPSDEPASVLLARPLGQRTASSTENVPRRPRQPRTTRAPTEASSMTKSRQDEDVRGQPYLAGHLRRLGVPTTAQSLFKEAELPVADFYKQLAWEIAEGHVKDNQTTLEPGHATG